MLEINIMVTEMKKACNGLTSALNTAKESW